MSTQSLSSIGNEADEITPEIADLARGLQYDPVKIFEYCYNYIEYEHYFGSKKGAALTLLEGRGNGFDTASLMVALLRASGYEAGYRYGARDLYDYEVADWLGLWYYGDDGVPFPQWTDAEFRAETDTVGDARDTLTLRFMSNYILFNLDRGFPAVEPDYWGDLWYIPHVWVQFEVDGIFYEADPSFKTLLPPTTVIDLEAATGYNRTAFLSDVSQGAEPGSGYIKGLHEVNLASNLTTYTTALTQWLKDNRPNSSVGGLINRRGYSRNSFTTLADLPIVWSGNLSYLSIQNWDAIPEAWMAKLHITAGVYDKGNESFTSTYYSDSITLPSLQGRKLSLTFDANTARLRLDEALLSTGSEFSVSGTTLDLQLSIDHPHGTYNQDTGVWTDDGSHDQSEVNVYYKDDNYAYAILYGFNPSGRLLRQRQTVLEDYLRDPAIADDSWQVTTELLNIMGLNWLLQTHFSNRVIAGQYNASELSHHRFGRMAQEGGYYVDMGLQFSGMESYDRSNPVKMGFQLQTLFDSALEHSLIEQMQGSDKKAVSTIKILQLANEQGLRVYRANASNWTSVRSHLAGKGYDNSSGGLLDSIGDSVLNQSGVLLIPEEPTVALDQWEGTGYALFSEGEDTFFAEMIISGGYFGGFLSEPAYVAPAPILDFGYSDSTYLGTASSGLIFGSDPITTPAYYGADPVDMASGAFVYDKADLQLGRKSPRGLRFSRHYNSNRRFDDSAGFGLGWTHNLDMYVTERSSIKAGLGETTSFQMAPYLAALAVAKDLYEDHADAKEWLAACLAVKWATDQLLYRAVAITMGSRTMEFVEMPDGTYAPPAGITASLSKDGSGNYVLSERHGNIYTFNSDNKIATIADQHGKVQTFTYSNGELTQVEDAYGRTLTLARNDGKIHTVSDSTGRSVQFGYTGNDLTVATDADGHGWTFAYDSDHRMTLLSDPENRIIVENTFDSKSRVDTQYSEGDPTKTWRLYYTGYANAEEDPEGAQTRYYYDERGRSIGVENALGQADGRGYNGQDHMTVYSTPKFEFTIRSYDADHNLTKTSDPLFNDAVNVYDAQHRLEVQGDFRGNETTYTYNAQHQVLTATDRKGIVVQTNTYNSDGDLETVTDAESNTTTYSYDVFGNVNRIDYPDTTYETFVYNARGDLLSTTDPRGKTTSFTYDDQRRVLVTTFPDTSTQIRTYDPSGNLASKTDNEENTTTYTYSSTQKLLTTSLPTTTAGTAVIANEYDSRDWLVRTIDPMLHESEFVYDSAKRLIEVIDPLQRKSIQDYDSLGRVVASTNPANETAGFQYNARGERIVKTDPLIRAIEYSFDENGNRTGIKNRRLNDYTFSFDPNNRLISLETPLGHVKSRTWNNRGLLETITEPSNQSTTFTYDSMGRVQSQVDAEGTITFIYDSNGNPTTITEGALVATRTYDDRNLQRPFRCP